MFNFNLDIKLPSFLDPPTPRELSPQRKRSLHTKEYIIENALDFKPFPVQVDWLKEVYDSPHETVLVLASRGYGKSDIIICLGLALKIYFDRKIQIVLICRNKDNSEQRITMINDILKRMGVKGKYNNMQMRTVENMGGFGKKRHTQPTLIAKLSFGSKQSTRADIVAFDDALDDQDETSRAMKSKVGKMFNASRSFKIGGKPFKRIVVANLIAEDDFHAKLKELALKEENRDEIKLVECWHGQIPLLDENREKYLLTNTLRNWHKYYMGQFIQDEKQPFSKIKFTNDFYELTAGDIYSCVDIAHGGGDYVALTIAKPMADKIECLGFVWKQGIWDIKEQITDVLIRVGASHLVIEKQSDPNFQMFDYFREQIPALKIRYPDKMNKERKMLTFILPKQHFIEFKAFPFLVQNQLEYRDMLHTYPVMGNDDAPDSLATLLMVFDSQLRYLRG